MRSILFIGIAGLLSACSTINYVGIETYNPAEVTVPENGAKVLIVNNAVPQPEDAGYEYTLQGEKQDAPVCLQELFKIESYVEMVLNYLRFEEMSNDLVLERNSLEQLVRQVVKKYAAIFIYNHISIQLEHLDYTVLTDEKWFCFVLEQILSNALKYTKQGSVKISAEESANGLRVLVKDTGIGIRSEDLPRIFEKGFTGYNGRMDKKASGLGLYLCKGVCEKLGHGISVASKEGEGTTVMITLQCEKVQQGDLVNM